MRSYGSNKDKGATKSVRTYSRKNRANGAGSRLHAELGNRNWDNLVRSTAQLTTPSLAKFNDNAPCKKEEGNPRKVLGTRDVNAGSTPNPLPTDKPMVKNKATHTKQTIPPQTKQHGETRPYATSPKLPELVETHLSPQKPSVTLRTMRDTKVVYVKPDDEEDDEEDVETLAKTVGTDLQSNQPVQTHDLESSDLEPPELSHTTESTHAERDPSVHTENHVSGSDLEDDDDEEEEDEEEESGSQRHVVVALAKFDAKGRRLARKTIQELGSDESFSNDRDCGTDATHIVIFDPAASMRNMKVLLGLARGAWILQESWLQASKEAGAWAPEETHEAMLQFPCTAQVRKWQADGTLHAHFLADVTCYADFADDSNLKAKDHFSQIIESFNGRLTDTLLDADLIVTVNSDEKDSPQNDLNNKDAHMIPRCHRDWLLEKLRAGETIKDLLPGMQEQQILQYSQAQAQAQAQEQQIQVFATPILERVLGFLEKDEVLCCTIAVNRRWADASRTASMRASVAFVRKICNLFETKKGDLSMVAEEELGLWKCSKGLAKNFPRGKFLSDGSYKFVYKVWCESAQRYEALSVMDYNSVYERSTVSVVAQEVDVAVQLSELVSRGICANFIETYQVFQTATAPLEDLWGSSQGHDDATEDASSTVSGSDDDQKIFQYIRMELCTHGDMEDHLKTYPGKILSVEATLGVFLQMVFSLHIGYEKVGLRHYDVKLLNFFVTKGSEQHGYAFQLKDGAQPLGLCDEHSGLIVKLADYGTASTRTTGRTVLDIDHFATQENAPPEYLFLGNDSPPEGSDSFALGLCLFHLFTGDCPYEEIMESVKCPTSVKRALKAIWTTEEWSVLDHVIADDPEDTMYHTLYRFLVLLDLPEEGSRFDKSQVGVALRGLLNSNKNTKAAVQFRSDRQQFAIGSGSHPLVSRASQRLAEAPYAIDVLKGLLAWDPEDRLQDYAAVLRHQAFQQKYHVK